MSPVRAPSTSCPTTSVSSRSDGTSGGLVSQTADGKLTIDFTASGAGGVNPDATYELGNPADPTNQTAFNISNLGGSTKDLTVAYNNVEAGSVDGYVNIEFALYNSTGTQVATVSEESTSATVSNVASGSTLYVVLTVDSTGLTSTNSLSGQLNVSA